MAAAEKMGPLQTERLVLRGREAVDAELLHLLWSERDVRVPPHRRLDAEGRPTVADLAAIIARANTHEAGPRLLTVVVKESGDAVGYCGLTIEPDSDLEGPGLAFELLQAAHGRGYATESSQAVIAWARAAGYRRLQAGVWDWNVASRHVLAKLGFREVSRDGAPAVAGQMVPTVLVL